jgi:hypothetical protein
MGSDTEDFQGIATLQTKAGYIDARPLTAKLNETLLQCTAGHTLVGGIEARIGLRMMPTFPRSSLSFRTAGFLQYGWKAGISGGTFPKRQSA